MSSTLTGPPLNASGSDPGFTVPPAPPANASNDPADNAAGTPPEMSVDGLAAIDAARSGADQAATPPPAEETAAPESEASATEPPAEAKADDTPPAIKREITIERNKRREADAARDAAVDARAAADARLEQALKALEALTPKPVEPTADPRPARDTFDSPDAYEEALTGWATRKATTEATAAADAKYAREANERAEAARVESQTAERTQLETAWQAKKTEAVKKYPDYEEVTNADVSLSPIMAESIIRAENGADISYHLGKNPAEAARILALPTAAAQIFEMGRLAATVAQPTPISVSRAPAPISPLSATREAATDTGREESMEEVASRVRKQAANGRTPMWGRTG